MKPRNKLNFHKHTYCEFQLADFIFFEENEIHYQSKSGSYYHYTTNGVYRYSNHWGRVANCRWKIDGIEDYKNQDYYVGYANWVDFFQLNSTQKVFYLEVNFETGLSKIVLDKETGCSSKYLMSLDFVFNRQKEIKSLFKDYKWAKYYNEDITVLRKKLIDGLINSYKTLQELKLNLKNEFD